MNIFNSLGSNYSFGFVLQAFVSVIAADSEHNSLKTNLQKSYPGEYVFTWKGRNALSLAIEGLGLQGKEVLTQAYTCWAVEEAIIAAKALPRFVDTGKHSLNLTVETLEKALQQNPDAKGVIVQHTLGYPADIEAIAKWCKAKKLYLIEDLAHSAFGQVEDGRLLGSFGDAAVFSFGRDKVIDAVSGGAVCFKETVSVTQPTSLPSTSTLLTTLLYPLITFKIRSFYGIGLGKVLHKIAKGLGILRSPIESAPQLLGLPAAIARLTNFQLKELDSSLAHRHQIAKVYDKYVHKKLTLKDTGSVYLRYAVLVKNREKVIEQLKTQGIHLSDTWYKHPVEIGSLKRSSSYVDGSCPNADFMSQHILNLPTHRYVSTERAKQIAEILNKVT